MWLMLELMQFVIIQWHQYEPHPTTVSHFWEFWDTAISQQESLSLVPRLHPATQYAPECLLLIVWACLCHLCWRLGFATAIIQHKSVKEYRRACLANVVPSWSVPYLFGVSKEGHSLLLPHLTSSQHPNCRSCMIEHVDVVYLDRLLLGHELQRAYQRLEAGRFDWKATKISGYMGVLPKHHLCRRHV